MTVIYKLCDIGYEIDRASELDLLSAAGIIYLRFNYAVLSAMSAISSRD
jgi:hypothetical protein